MIDVQQEIDQIASRMKERRLELGLSLREMEKLVGIKYNTLYRYEQGNMDNFPMSKVKDMAHALQVTPEWLLGWDAKKPKTDEDRLIESFRKLNEEGKAAVLAMTQGLTYNERYKKNDKEEAG